MPRRRRGAAEVLNPWPGYVDALSTLLMVIIFVLLVFVLAQAFLSVALSGRDRALDRLNQQMTQLSDLLSLEQGRTTELRASIARTTLDLQKATAEREDLARQLGGLSAETQRVTADRDALRLAAEEAQRSVQADRATLEARLSDLARLRQEIEALAALRDQYEAQARDAAARATTEQQRREAAEATLADQRRLGDSDKAQFALVTQQLASVRDELASVRAALGAADAKAGDKDTQIAELGQRLNVALKQKVEELQRYRSEFFGRLRQVLANRPGIQVAGDRFVFQSEVLFPPGSADMNVAGQDQIAKLAATLKQIAAEIPPDVKWVLRVDGHADRQPLNSGSAYDNWDLSAKRAINVVHRLIAEGVAPNRLAATAFAENQPLDSADTVEAYGRNRRIEIRLTDR